MNIYIDKVLKKNCIAAYIGSREIVRSKAKNSKIAPKIVRFIIENSKKIVRLYYHYI